VRRREFAAALGATALPAAAQENKPAQTAIPRWRGFNLLDLFQAWTPGMRPPTLSPEDDFKWIRDWGFDFVRIPLDYWFWTDADWKSTRSLNSEDTFRIWEPALAPIDRIVDLGRKYSLHVSINLHRAPGYCINNPEREPFSLWSDPTAEMAFAYHWEMFAKRYRGVSARDLSFNLLNEAPTPRAGYMSRADYARVMTHAAEVIRAISPDRVIIIDGLDVGNAVVDEMIPSGVVQSVHAYYPSQISHYRASWVDRNSSFPMPTWPLLDKEGKETINRATLEKRYGAWADLSRRGIGVHCGEAGAYSRTPHEVVLAWMQDTYDILTGHGIGWALWNFRGTFGILNSGRDDVAYEDWYGLKLDRKMLELLRAH
jgi:endoglucanase